MLALWSYIFLISFPDVDECANEDENDCGPNSLCTNTEGSYICRCLKGYIGDGKNCSGQQNIKLEDAFLLEIFIVFPLPKITSATNLQTSTNVLMKAKTIVIQTPFALTPKDLTFVAVWEDTREMEENAQVSTTLYSNCLFFEYLIHNYNLIFIS